jgi:hypothetical protein
MSESQRGAFELVGRLREKGHDTSVDSVTLIDLKEGASYQIGFLLCEKYDFGTAQKVNALYSALLKLTPFSKDEAATYARVLRDRNLLVHHGGTYTARYLAQLTGEAETDPARPFMDSLVEHVRSVLRSVDPLGLCIVAHPNPVERSELRVEKHLLPAQDHD